MTRARTNASRTLTKWLIGVNVFLAAVIVGELALSFIPSGSVGAPEDFLVALPDRDPARLLLPPAHELADLTERPLFSSTRRPFEEAPEPAAQPAAAAPPPALVLIGTVIKPGKRSALFTTRSTRQLIQLDVGVVNGGWELVDVTTDTAIFERDDRRHEIFLAQ